MKGREELLREIAREEARPTQKVHLAPGTHL